MFPAEFPFLFPEQGGNNRGWDISGPWLWGKVPVGSCAGCAEPSPAFQSHTLTHPEERACSCRDGPC